MKLLQLGGVVVALFIAFFVARWAIDSFDSPQSTGATAGSTATAQVGSASPTPGALVVPTAAIPLPTNCPALTAAQVDNPALYGFCTPVGWGAYNENNSSPLTLIMRAKAGGQPVLLPTDFDRIVILIAIDTPAPQAPPPECTAPPNDSIAGWAAHHCTATLDPTKNPYHGVRAEYWTIDLANDHKFYISATVGQDASDADQAEIPVIVHAIQPPKQ